MIRGAASLVCEDDHDKPRVQRRYAIPSKHDELTQCCFNVGPPSSASAQRKNSIGSKHLVFAGIPFLKDLIIYFSEYK